MNQDVPGKDLYELQKKQKEEAKRREQRRETLIAAPKKIGKYLLYGLIAATAIGGVGWYVATRPEVPAEEVVSRSGLHWHPELSISINGKKESIPANIGIGIRHNSIHTHDTTGQIHLEFSGLVRKDDLRVEQFFKVLGKTFNREQILDYRNGPEGTVKMSVNGTSSDQFENYVMQDKDKIEIRYEK